jgi:hypothetical protein
MLMRWKSFNDRCEALERMDVECLSPEDTRRIFDALEAINRWLGGVRATLHHFNRFARRWRLGETIRIVDWGTGGADIPRALAQWGRRRGFRLEITAVDSNANTIAEARRRSAAFPEISLVHMDAREVPFASQAFDYAISSLTLHHLRDDEIVSLLRTCDRVVRRGIVMNDLHRCRRAWFWIWMLSRMARAHPVVCDDGPLSVRRAFTKKDLAGYAAAAGVSYLEVNEHFGHRLVLAGERA